MPDMETRRHEFAFVFGGGGARGAYQVGLLRHVARRHPGLSIPILTGVSAGAINAAFLANHTATFGEKVDDLVRFWRDLTIDRVFRVDGLSLLGNALGVAARLALLGGRRTPPRARGLVETDPLRTLLLEAYRTSDGRLAGIERNLEHGRLRAVALTTTSYNTGQTITFCEGSRIQTWERPMRRSVAVPLSVDHVMASAALPLFFPAVRIGDDWHGDGGIRLHSPLAPAAHLGAVAAGDLARGGGRLSGGGRAAVRDAADAGAERDVRHHHDAHDGELHPSAVDHLRHAVRARPRQRPAGRLRHGGGARAQLAAQIGFAAAVAAATYVILDLEFPRLGMLRVDTFDQALVDLRRGMDGPAH